MTANLTADAVLAQPGRCVECGGVLESDAVVALCARCCPHSREHVVYTDDRDGANGREHLDCIACGAEVDPVTDEDGVLWYETHIPVHPWRGLR